MSYLMLTTVAAILVLMCVKWKGKAIIPIILFLYAVLIMVCCTDNADLYAMESRYVNHNFGDFPIGFRVIIALFESHNLSFYAFKAIYAAVILGVVYIFYKKNTPYVALASALFFIYPFDSFFGQIRNAISAVIAMAALFYYIKSERVYRDVVYIGLVVAASLIHPSSVIYLLALLCRKNFGKKVYFWFALIFCGLVVVVFYSGILGQIIASVIHSDRIIQWFNFSMRGNIFGSLLVILAQIVWTWLIGYARSLINFTYIFAQGKQNRIFLTPLQADLLVKVNYLFLLLLPFYMVSHMYFRMFKYLLIVDYILVCQAIYSRNQKRQLICLTIIAALLTHFFSAWVSGGGPLAIPAFYNSFDLDHIRNIFC